MNPKFLFLTFQSVFLNQRSLSSLFYFRKESADPDIRPNMLSGLCVYVTACVCANTRHRVSVRPHVAPATSFFPTALAASCDRYASQHQHIQTEQPRQPASGLICPDGHFLLVAWGITRWMEQRHKHNVRCYSCLYLLSKKQSKERPRTW